MTNFTMLSGKDRRDEIASFLQLLLREQLYCFKGAKLSLLVYASSLCNDEGVCRTDIETLCRQTGYNKITMTQAIAALAHLRALGQQVLFPIVDLVSKRLTGFVVLPTVDQIVRYSSAGTNERESEGLLSGAASGV